MALFRYVGTLPDGMRKEGQIVAATLESAVSQLSSQGVTVEDIHRTVDPNDPLSVPPSPRPVEAPAGTAPSHSPGGVAEASRTSEGPPTDERSKVQTDLVGPLVGGVPLSDLQFFFRQLSTMLNAGLGAAQAMDILTKQTRHPKLKSIVEELKEHIISGRPMSVGMQRYPEVFSPLMMSMVRTGEEGGMLSDQTRQLADYIQRDIELRNLIRRETAYPKLVLVAAVVVIAGANGIIAAMRPGASRIYSPLTDPRVLILLIPLVIVGWIVFRLIRRRPEVLSSWHSFTSSLPWFGDMVRGFAMARFGRAFGALYAAGVPMPKAFRLAADACGNESLRFKMQPAADQLEQGVSMSQAFINTNAFNPLVIDMVRTGEMTGNVDLMLNKMAEYYEDEGSVKARQSALVLGVLVFLAVGIYVGYVIISFYTGHFSGIADAAGS